MEQYKKTEDLLFQILIFFLVQNRDLTLHNSQRKYSRERKKAEIKQNAEILHEKVIDKL